MSRGEVFADNFEVSRLLAEGGMGMVYEVKDRASGEMRALKVLLPELVSNERTRRRFAQEAKVTQRIDHPAIPTIFGVGIDDSTGIPFISMELLDGVDLRDHVDKHGALEVAEARPILLQVCAALAAAHRAGVVHRDIKPENVFLQRRDGVPAVKLLDFGIIKELDPHQTSAPGTGAIGSPMWMAPEQTSAGGRIAPATDCWALGLLCFYVLTGKLYWKAAHEDTGVSGLLRELHLDDIDPASIRCAELAPEIRLPEGFDTFFAKAMARDSKERFKDASEALPELEAALTPALQDRSADAYAKTLRVHRDELVPRSHTHPMGSGVTGPLVPTPGAPAVAPDTLPASPSPLRSVPMTSEYERDELAIGLAPTAAVGPAPGGRALSPSAATATPEERIPNTDPPAPMAAQRAALPTASHPGPANRPPPQVVNNLILWVAIACVVGFIVAVLTALLVWALLTALS